MEGTVSAALLEINPEELRRKIELADEAIRRRYQELASAEGVGVREELQAIADAQQNLRTLRRMELRLPVVACVTTGQSSV